MAESDADGSSEDGAATDSPDAPAVKKASAAAALDDGGVVRSRRAGWSLQLELAELLGPIGGVALEDGLRVQDVDASPLSASPTPLSPTGLISIAAADIDEATSPQGPRDLDWEFIESLRRASVGGTTAPRRGSTLYDSALPRRASGELMRVGLVIHSGVDDVVAQIVGPVSSSEDGGPSKLRFLSLLRRINEIRSQQHVDVGSVSCCFTGVRTADANSSHVDSMRCGKACRTRRSWRCRRSATRSARRRPIRARQRPAATRQSPSSTTRCAWSFGRVAVVGESRV